MYIYIHIYINLTSSTLWVTQSTCRKRSLSGGQRTKVHMQPHQCPTKCRVPRLVNILKSQQRQRQPKRHVQRLVTILKSKLYSDFAESSEQRADF